MRCMIFHASVARKKGMREGLRQAACIEPCSPEGLDKVIRRIDTCMDANKKKDSGLVLNPQ